MQIGDYPARGKPYWITMAGVTALGAFGLFILVALH